MSDTPYQIYDMTEHIPLQTLLDFTDFITSDHWLEGVPGGFLTNSPKRKVNAFGNGGYDTTYWTAQMKSASVTLHTRPNPLPPSFLAMIPHLKDLFKLSHPDAQITDDTFSIGVCNYYTEPDMYIAAHTDDNVWYPKECSAGTVFASITLYPHGQPDEPHFSRFQIHHNGKWHQVNLPHNSVMIMPSNIQHRVQPFLKSKTNHFKPRINVTFRSTFPKKIDPLMHLMAISNHARYYCIPHAITIPSSSGAEIDEILDAYINFCDKYNQPFDLHIRDRDRKTMIQKYRNLHYPPFRITNNMVTEVFETILQQK
jgi:hypothetical protein